MTTEYDPTSDSSPGAEQYLPEDAGDGTTPGVEGLILLVDDGQCACGCGEATTAKREFRQGHDAKLKGKLIRAHVNDIEVHTIGSGGIVSTDAMNLAKQRGWEPHLEAAEHRHQTREANRINREREREQRAAAKPRKKGGKVGTRRKIRVGRWEYTGKVVGLNDDYLVVEYTTKKGETKTTQIPR